MYRNASVIRRSDIRQPKASGMAPNPEKKKAASWAASEQLLKKPATAKIAESSRGAEDYTRGAAIGWEGGQRKRSALIGRSAYKRQSPGGGQQRSAGLRRVLVPVCWGRGGRKRAAAGGASAAPSVSCPLETRLSSQPEAEEQRCPRPPLHKKPARGAGRQSNHRNLLSLPGAASSGLETPRT